MVNGNIGHVGLKDYQGEKYVLLVFYPMDFVYAESILPFSNRVEEFKKLNTEVLAMSTDSVYSHKAFFKATKYVFLYLSYHIWLIKDRTRVGFYLSDFIRANS